MRDKDSELRGLISDLYNKYPNTEAILVAGASVVQKQFSSLINKVKNYTGQYRDEFIQQLYPINRMLNSALQREQTINVRSQSSELLASILKLMEDFEKGELSQTLALPKLKDLTEEFESLKNKPAFKALPEDERKDKENTIAAQLFMVEKVLSPTVDRDNIKDRQLSVKGGVQRDDVSKVFDELYELLSETLDDSVNSIQIPSPEEKKLSEPEKKESQVEQDIEDHVLYLERSIDPRRMDEHLRKLNEELTAYDEKKSLASQENLGSVDSVIGAIGFGEALKQLDGDAKQAVRRKDQKAIENLEIKVTELQGQLERSRSDNSSQSDRFPYRKMMASILQVAINDLTRIKDFLKAARNELLNQTQNKRASTQILEGGPSKKTRIEARSIPVSPDVNIVIPKEKIINGISHFIEPHSIPVDITRSVHQYNQARDQLYKLNPSSKGSSEIQEKLNNSRNSICRALGFDNELAVLESLVNNAGTTQNKENAKKLYDGASALSNVLEAQLDKLEKKQRTFEALGQKSPRIDAAADVIDVSIIRLDQLKSQLVKHLPAKDREQIAKTQFDFSNKNKH